MIKWILLIIMIHYFYLKILQLQFKIYNKVNLRVILTFLIHLLHLFKHNKYFTMKMFIIYH